MDTYILIMGVTGIVMLSYLFNFVSKRFSIPSVLLLIALGIGISLAWADIQNEETQTLLKGVLPILGTVGLIMIVLEAALDLKLEREKSGLIIKSFFAALVILLVTTFLVACVLAFILDMSAIESLIHAVPLSIMSSAIIIPSVGSLRAHKKEFLIYESTFSDILGIMLFYFLKDGYKLEGAGPIMANISLNIIITLLAAILISFAMIWVFQRIKATVGLFFLISVLVFVYAFAKMFHLSSLLIILFFGLLLNNKELIFKGRLEKWIEEKTFKHMYDHFKIVIEESAFLIRTFFFVVFGMSIQLSSMLRWNVFIISVVLLAIMYGVRYINLKFITRSPKIFPEIFVAPRGLITVLLFYAIPSDLRTDHFDTGILLMVILSTSIIMMVALIKNRSVLAQYMDNDTRDEVADSLSPELVLNTGEQNEVALESNGHNTVETNNDFESSGEEQSSEENRPG